MTVSPEIYLDLDGVCVDFISAAIAAHGHDPNEVLDRWAADHPGEFYPYKVLEMEVDSFWDLLHSLGESFWVQLEPYPWFEELHAKLDEMGHVVFCTSSTRAPSCLSGKLHWLQARFGAEFQDYVLTAHKERLAHKSAFLIDDFDQNVDRFSARGGHGILFPQFWNSNHGVNGDRVTYVIDQVAQRLT